MALYVVDGTFELFRCFHGAPRVKNASGREVGAVRGLAHTLISLLRREDLTHVAVAFDSGVSRVRRGDMSPGALIRGQLPLALDVCRALGISVWPMKRCQADDALASAAVRYRNEVERVVICSSDKDFFQCIMGERVVVWNRITKKIMNETLLRNHYGVTPTQFPSFLALVGDPSDGIPGIPGFGRQTTASILDAFSRLEDIPTDASRWPGVRGRRKLAQVYCERRQEALLYRELSTLRQDIPLVDRIEDLHWRGADRLAFSQLISDLSDDDLAKRTLHFRLS